MPVATLFIELFQTRSTRFIWGLAVLSGQNSTSSAQRSAGIGGNLEPRNDYGLGVLSWQILAPRFCAPRAARVGRSACHGARMPSLQDLETVPENSQLKPTILLHRDPGCNGLAASAAVDTSGPPIRNVEAFSKPPRHRTPEFFIAAAAASVAQPAGSCRRPLGRLWSRYHSAVQSPGDRSASAMTTHTGAHDSIHLRIVY